MQRSAGAPTLLLVPTGLEEARLLDLGGLPPGYALRALCGFGPVAAAARTAELCALLRPRRVCLVGIAGSYDRERLAPGTAHEFTEVAIDGVGVGEGERFQGPPALGFAQLPGPGPTGGERDDEESSLPVVDRLPLTPLAGPSATSRLLLTTCAASDSPRHAAERLARFPTARAEDMEAFGVALAARLSRTPVAVVRGISNQVGDRDPRNWCIARALAAARRLLLDLLEGAERSP